jgi:hypothetical protein
MNDSPSPRDIGMADARTFVDAVRTQLGVELAYDRSGVEWLDGYLASTDEYMDAEALYGLTNLAGSFLGECIADESDGEWTLREGRRCVQFAGDDAIDPFWMVDGCLRYRRVYRAAALFEAVPAIARVRTGGLYAVRNDDGSFGIDKVLAVDHLAVHVRFYGNSFAELPSHIDTTTLAFRIRAADLERSDDNMPVGHLPVAHQGFWAMQPTLVQVDPVGHEESEGYRIWLAGT